MHKILYKIYAFGFTNIDVDGEDRLQCLYYTEILAVNSMKQDKLKRHLETVHTECVGKILESEN
jgi:hypothetical protein